MEAVGFEPGILCILVCSVDLLDHQGSSADILLELYLNCVSFVLRRDTPRQTQETQCHPPSSQPFSI
jgi:hypothetical protein